jgi:hypothetical protein
VSATNSRGFWITNRLANPVLRPLLLGPLGRRLGRRLAVLRYSGRRTGQIHELVVQYARHNNQVWIMPAHAERKRWWRNMLDPQPVDVWLAGRHLVGVARVVGDGPSAKHISSTQRSGRVPSVAFGPVIPAGHFPPISRVWGPDVARYGHD